MSAKGFVTYPIEIPPWIRCHQCSTALPFQPAHISNYFAGTQLQCSECRSSWNWWSIACLEVENNHLGSQAFAFLGARTSIFKLTLREGNRIVYRFCDYEIPNDANILYVNYTPSGGGLFPVELHGNVSRPRFFPDEIVVFPVPLNERNACVDTEVTVMVSWVPTSINDDSFRSLVVAFEAFSAGVYQSMIVPANVAVESALSCLLTGFLTAIVSKKRAEDFLDQGATYSHQLNVVLPLITSLQKLPQLPDPVRESLNDLRNCRNSLAHSGVLRQELTQKAAARLLCGALFGLHYVRYLELKLGQLPKGL